MSGVSIETLNSKFGNIQILFSISVTQIMETQLKNQSKQLGVLGPMFFKFWMMKTELYNSIFINPNTICLLEFISTLLYLKAKMQHLLFLCCY